jgi:2-polyprenyl-3-methyl-5-hydroxy-6-metoxy-1,4-benzoquinol methylase
MGCLCGSQDARPLLRYDKPDQYEEALGIGAEGYWRSWVQCSACGLHRSESSKDEGTIQQIYESAYRDQSADWRQRSAENRFLKIMSIPPEDSETQVRIGWLLKSLEMLGNAGLVSLPKGPHVLDIGGASGVFAHSLSLIGWAAEVIDPCQEGAFIEKYGVKYHQSFYISGLELGRYDGLSMIFMLEHVADPLETLRQSRANLKDKGFLFIEVPDASAFATCGPDHDTFNSCHLWLFTPKTLSMLLEQAGYTIHSIQRGQTKRGYPNLLAIAG